MSKAPHRISTIAELRSRLDQDRGEGQAIGFVATMGYLHDGHGSLMAQARVDNDITVASIFVNPLQFGPNEDLATYPRDLERDTAVAARNGVDVLFTPTVDEMYPHDEVLTSVSVSGLSSAWDGASRPGHFDGMATVVTKLLSIVGPCRAYFGEKDFQQLAIIRRLVDDLSLPIDVVGCPIVREGDGLAMSSRNVFLDDEHRRAATVLRRALDVGEQALAEGERRPTEIDARMAEVVGREPLAKLDYAAAVDANTLTQPERLGPHVRLIIAAHLGSTRLIDNTGVTIDSEQPTGAS